LPERNFFPESPYDIIAGNKKMGLHTLVLLDIPMTPRQGIELLLELEKRRKRGILSEGIVVCSCLGTKNMKIAYGRVEALKDITDMPSVIIIPGKLHFKEEEALELCWKKS
jgi:diphthine synthase